MNFEDINDFVPSLLNPRCVKKQNCDISLTQNSAVSRSSLSLRRNCAYPKPKVFIKKKAVINKENRQNEINFLNDTLSVPNKITAETENDKTGNLGFSAIGDLNSAHNIINLTQIHRSPSSFKDVDCNENNNQTDKDNKINESLISVSSATELNDNTLAYDYTDKTVVSVSFGLNDCKHFDINSSSSRIKRISVQKKYNVINVDCDIVESSLVSTEGDLDRNMNVAKFSPQKRKAVAVNLEIKKNKLTITDKLEENSKVLILNTNAIEKISHVIVQPPNYKLVNRQNLNKSEFQKGKRKSALDSVVNNESGIKLKQKPIDSFFPKCTNILNIVKVSEGRTLEKSLKCDGQIDNVVRDEVEMSKNSNVADTNTLECGRSYCKGNWKDNEALPRSARVASSKKYNHSPKRSDIKMSSSEAPRVPSSKGRNDCASSHTPRIKVDSLHFSLPARSKSIRTSATTRNIPHHKIVAGTHFAVDAFSYGDIPNVKHYFLTHFHSDHYSGLKKSFNKLLFCSKISADLCISRLGVNPKCIHIINVDQTMRVEGVEVTAIEANHCPGAVMLVFTLPNGKTLLHTGDFRASPTMESYPVFWNKDIHTIYLDTTYCNPRYDFPTQDQSLEMALYILRQKKMELEKAGKKFASVLIVCGTYTIGKEKFFLGMAHRVGCAVWACPEKDRVLQTVEGRSFSHAPPQSCQLHVVPMRDLTHEKLRSYLDSLQGAFSEVVAFKPSGWEIGKNTSVENNMVTIHGIPYSEHSSFSEIIRFVKYLKPKQVVPTVDISGGIKAVQKYFPCPLVYKEDMQCQSKVTDYFSIHNRQQVPAVT